MTSVGALIEILAAVCGTRSEDHATVTGLRLQFAACTGDLVMLAALSSCSATYEHVNSQAYACMAITFVDVEVHGLRGSPYHPLFSPGFCSHLVVRRNGNAQQGRFLHPKDGLASAQHVVCVKLCGYTSWQW